MNTMIFPKNVSENSPSRVASAVTGRTSLQARATVRLSRSAGSAATLLAAVLWQATIAAIAGVNSEMKLASSAAGRVVLHLLCARRDHHYRWHWQGVRREFARI